MIRRNLQKILNLSLSEFPVVALTGPRQSGKTTIARQLRDERKDEVIYLDLEKPADLAKLSEPELYLSQQHDKLVILDEIQHKPDLFPLIRVLVDEDRRNGRFLVLGSASPELLRQSSETLAGRITYHELTPFLLNEISGTSNDKEALMKLWLRGGFPLAFLADSEAVSMRWRQSFIRSYIERDLPGLGFPADPMMTRRFLSMTAASAGAIWNAQSIGRSLDLSHPTINRYRDFLEQTFLIRVLQPYFTNIRKRLVKSPKIYFRDSGLLHTLLDIHDMDTLLGKLSSGYSWEGFIIEQVAGMISSEYQLWFISTHQGAEVDLLITRHDQPIAAIEIKLSDAPSLPRGFLQLVDELKTRYNFLVTPSSDQYPVHENISVVSIMELCSMIAEW